MSTKSTELFITAIKQVAIDGDINIPTRIVYKPDGRVSIGNAAALSAKNATDIMEDFKLELGKHRPGSASPKRRFVDSSGTPRQASQLADDFLFAVLKEVRQFLDRQSIGECKHIVVAEPLAIHTDDISPEWLPNYRSNIRRMLEGKQVLAKEGAKVRFIPEPFAAYQYYRHGLRHPVVSHKTKSRVLVVDFGGGTLDVCLIETTQSGELSQSGQNSKPLFGKSENVGGFYINRCLAYRAFEKLGSAFESQLKKGYKLYKSWLNSDVSFDTLDAQYKYFIRNFHDLVHRTENVKLALSRSIVNWKREVDASFAISVELPENPFIESSKRSAVRITIEDFKEVFRDDIY